MKTFTIEDIRSWQPCYDPGRHLPEGWSGTAVDLLKLDTIPPQDRLWVVLREELIDAKILRLFAVWCARQVEHLLTDERSKQAIEVAERYANDQATKRELHAARDAANAALAARDAADAANAAWAAANAARDAALAAANAARDAALAARDAADAANAANAAWAAAAAARAATRDAQVAQLLKMLEENKTPEEMAEEYTQTIEPCCGTSDILIAAENAFLAGYKAAKDQIADMPNYLEKAFQAGHLFMATGVDFDEWYARVFLAKQQLADVSKVTTKPPKEDK